MRYPKTMTMAAMFVALGMTRAAVLEAQSTRLGSTSDTATRLAIRSQQRTSAWKDAAPIIHCGPAPLTERPGASADAARPHLAPLEQAFLDAAVVRREIAARSPTVVKRP